MPGDWIKPGAIVIDVGINRLPDGKLCGDVDFDAGEGRRELDHAGAGRRGADDDRDAAREHAGGGALAIRELDPRGKRMRAIPAGTTGSFTMVVSPEHLANRFKDAMLPAVFATPMMILAMENAALEAMKPFFEPGETAVGTRVDVRHLAATPVGRRVTAYAEVTNASDRRVDFRVWAMDGEEQIGVGEHERAVIDIAKFTARLTRSAGATPSGA